MSPRFSKIWLWTSVPSPWAEGVFWQKGTKHDWWVCPSVGQSCKRNSSVNVAQSFDVALVSRRNQTFAPREATQSKVDRRRLEAYLFCVQQTSTKYGKSFLEGIRYNTPNSAGAARYYVSRVQCNACPAYDGVPPYSQFHQRYPGTLSSFASQ